MKLDEARELFQEDLVNEPRVKSIEEYYALLEELHGILRKGHDLKKEPRVIELEELLDEYEKAMFPSGGDPIRSGGRF